MVNFIRTLVGICIVSSILLIISILDGYSDFVTTFGVIAFISLFIIVIYAISPEQELYIEYPLPVHSTLEQYRQTHNMDASKLDMKEDQCYPYDLFKNRIKEIMGDDQLPLFSVKNVEFLGYKKNNNDDIGYWDICVTGDPIHVTRLQKIDNLFRIRN